MAPKHFYKISDQCQQDLFACTHYSPGTKWACWQPNLLITFSWGLQDPNSKPYLYFSQTCLLLSSSLTSFFIVFLLPLMLTKQLIKSKKGRQLEKGRNSVTTASSGLNTDFRLLIKSLPCSGTKHSLPPISSLLNGWVIGIDQQCC